MAWTPSSIFGGGAKAPTPPAGAPTPPAEVNNPTNDEAPAYANLWKPNEAAPTETPAAPQVIQVQAPTAEPTAEERMGTHMDSIGLSVTVTEEDLQDPAKMSALMTKAARDSYQAGLNDSSRMDKKALDEAVKLAVAQSTGNANTTQLRQDLQAAYPFAADPLIAPVAETVLKNLMTNNKLSQDDAMKALGPFFAQLASAVHKDLPPPPPSGGNAYNPGGSGHGEVDDTDWVALLSQSPST